MSDELGDFIAALDQARAGLANFAELIGDYHGKLVEQGFSREEALALVMAYQGALLAGSGAGGS